MDQVKEASGPGIRNAARQASGACASLTIDQRRGVAWQTDLLPTAEYGDEYWERYRRYDATPMGARLNAIRVAMVARYCEPWTRLVDVGIGGGGFLTAARHAGFLSARGYDVNPHALAWLHRRGMFADPYARVAQALTFWDVFEHLPDPDQLVGRLPVSGKLFLSLPIFDDLDRLRESKHFRPGEHLWYFTDQGLRTWFHERGFELLESHELETAAGREAIRSYAFQRA